MAGRVARSQQLFLPSLKKCTVTETGPKTLGIGGKKGDLVFVVFLLFLAWETSSQWFTHISDLQYN